MKENPSVVEGFRLALRLRKLVAAVWIAGLAAFLPAQLVVSLAAAPVRGNLPARPLPVGDDFLILVETLRPVAVPLALALISGCLALAAWSIAWHAGVVRWWMGAGAARVRLAEILGHGIVWWWRYARLALVGALSIVVALAAVWLPLRLFLRGTDSGAGVALLLASGVLASLFFVIAGWIATLRGGWYLGESGRRSSVVAWLRGFGTTLRRPFHSVLPVVVWAVPAAILAAAPLVVQPPWATPTLFLASLAASFCWVALYLSFAPREPADEWVQKMQARAAARVAAPAEKPDPYKTGRFPTQPTEEN